MNSENVSIACDVDDEKLDFHQEVNVYPLIDKIDYLRKKDLISEEEKIGLYIDNLKNKKIKSEDEIIKALSVINSYQNRNSTSKVFSDEIAELNNSYTPDYNNEAVYTNGDFSIHYEVGTISDYNLFLISHYFNYVKSTLCFTYEFEVPKSAPDDLTYNVYITSGESYSGLTIGYYDFGKVYSFININIDDGNDTLSNYTLGTTYHEYMHAVQFQYDAYSNTNHSEEMVYFNEAVANSIEVRLQPNSGIKQFVDIFQNSPELSLLSSPSAGDYQYRCYGAVLFPLCIEQEYAEFNTIKNIYEENKEAKDVYASINNVLSDYNSNIQEAYNKCVLYNYNIQHYYDYCETNWQTSPKMSEISSQSKYYEMPLLSTRYFEISNSKYSVFALTIDTENDISNVNLQRVDTKNNELSSTHYSLFTHKVTAIFNIEIGQKTCFILSNDSLNSSVKCFVSVA